MSNPHYVWPDHILTLTGAPDPLITTADAKAHLRVDTSDDDTYIDSLVSVASAMMDGPNGMVGKAIATQQWTLKQGPMIGTEPLNLPVLPFRDVVSIAYYDENNTLQTLATPEAIGAVFTTFGNEDWGQIAPVTIWPAMYQRADALTVVFHAGYGDPADCPANLRHAALLLIGHWYQNRENVTIGQAGLEMPMAAKDLINVSRIGWAAG